MVFTHDVMAAAATDSVVIDSTISAANRGAVADTTQVLTAAGDEVSVAIAALHSGHRVEYQVLSRGI